MVLQSVTLYMAQALSNLTKAVSSDEDADPAKARAFGDSLLIGLFAAANLPRPLNWISEKSLTAQILACVTLWYPFLTIQFGSCPFTWLIGLIVSRSVEIFDKFLDAVNHGDLHFSFNTKIKVHTLIL